MVYRAYLTIGGKDWREQRSWNFKTEQELDEFIEKWRWGFDPLGLMPVLLQINFCIKFLVCLPLFSLSLLFAKLGDLAQAVLSPLCENEVIITKDGEMTHRPKFARYKNSDDGE